MDIRPERQRKTSTGGMDKRCTRGVLILLLSPVLLVSYVMFWGDRGFALDGRNVPHPALQTHYGDAAKVHSHRNRNRTTYMKINSKGRGIKSSNVKSTNRNIIIKNRNILYTNVTNHGDHRNLTVVGTGQFFIYTVVAEQLLSTLKWQALIFSGWEERYAMDTTYRCCLSFKDGSVSTSETKVKRLMWNKAPMVARQVVCQLNNTVPVLAGLVLANQSCNQDTVYLKPVYRNREKAPQFAICAKIAYGGKNARELVEWMEYHRYYGASAVVIYPYADLNHEAYKVLEYYATEGHLEMVPLPFVPKRDVYPRQFRTPSRIKDQDEQVANFDAQERLRAYKYYTVMDTDEFITPLYDNTTNFLQLMEHLLSENKMASSFRLLTEVHLQDWGMTGSSRDLTIAQYGYHTEPVKLTQKLLHVTKRIEPGTMWIHDAKPIKYFKQVTAKPSIVVLKHYRTCKQWWFRVARVKKPCLEYFQKIRGHFMENVAKRIHKRVVQVEEKLQLI